MLTACCRPDGFADEDFPRMRLRPGATVVDASASGAVDADGSGYAVPAVDAGRFLRINALSGAGNAFMEDSRASVWTLEC